MSQNTNQPKRYACLRQFGMLPAEDGIWVEYEDYAALAAENERLRSASFVTAVPSEEYEKLKAENERLRKAGDRLASATIIFETMSEEERAKRRSDWLAAKEGGAK